MLKILSLESGYGSLKILKSVSLHVFPGEIVSIIGANGAGKTTLVKTIMGLISAKSGDMVFNQHKITHLSTEEIVDLGCVMVPEGRQVFAPMSVEDNLILGAYKRWNKKHKQETKQRFEEILDLFPILRERRKQFAGTLSGGEQQMLAIGRALMSNPKLLIMDEPSMGIAPKIVKQIFKTVVDLKEKGLTILLIEQNAHAALNISDRGYVIETGQVVMEGSAVELLDNKEVQRAYLGKDYKQIND